jgi:endonuclease/exonuclease/phosphatase family metal-dependent hydrolase
MNAKRVGGLPSYNYAGFFSEIFLAFIFWSTILEFPATLWFFPLVEMGLTGKEVMLALAGFGVFLGIKKLRKFIYNHQGIAYVSTLVGITAYLVNELNARSIILGSGVAFGVIVQWAMLWNPNSARRDRAVYAHMLGLLCLISGRFALCTINPIFFVKETNIAALVLGLISCFVISKDSTAYEATDVAYPDAATSVVKTLRFGVGFGLLFFLTNFFLTSHAVLPRNYDVHPFPYGIGVIGTMILGLLFSNARGLVRSWVFYLTTLVTAVLSVAGPSPKIELAYFMIFYVFALWPSTVEDASLNTRPGSATAIAGLTYVFFLLAVVWTVAYNFVPGGPYVREMTNEMVFISLIGLGLATVGTPSGQTKRRSAGFLPPARVIVALLIISAVIIAPAVYKRAQNYQNYDTYLDKTKIRGMVWATHFGYDNLGWPSNDQMLDMIHGSGANIVALVETDAARLYMGNRDFMEWFEDKMHVYTDYGSSTMNNTWGCGILSAFPIKRAHRYNLPSPEGEIACLIDAVLDVNGKELGLITVHFGNDRDKLDRQLQADATRDLVLAHGDRPVLWLGYLVDHPGGKNYKKMISAGLVDTAPNEMRRWCLYIFSKGLEQESFKRIDTGDVSDTEIQTATFDFKQ